MWWQRNQFIWQCVNDWHRMMTRSLTRTFTRSKWHLFIQKGAQNKPRHGKTNTMTCAPSVDSDHPGHPPSLISLCCPHVGSLLTHLSRRLTRWAYRIALEPASVCPCVRPSVRPLTISNMNISKTRGPIANKFYLKNHWGGGFGSDRIRTLVSMATDSSHRVIMGKTASPRFLGCIWSDPFHTCR